jgi:hypothetical protein
VMDYQDRYLSLQQQQEQRLGNQWNDTSALQWDQSNQNWTRILGDNAGTYSTYDQLLAAAPAGMVPSQVYQKGSGWGATWQPTPQAQPNPLAGLNLGGLSLRGATVGLGNGTSLSYGTPQQDDSNAQYFQYLDARRKWLSDQLYNARALISSARGNPDDPNAQAAAAQLPQLMSEYTALGKQLQGYGAQFGNGAVGAAMNQLAPWTPFVNPGLNLGTNAMGVGATGPSSGSVGGTRYTISPAR